MGRPRAQAVVAVGALAFLTDESAVTFLPMLAVLLGFTAVDWAVEATGLPEGSQRVFLGAVRAVVGPWLLLDAATAI